MIYSKPADQVIDDAAIAAFHAAHREATELPPIAIVIAAYNEAGAIGPVVESLPKVACGMAVATIVVSDGSTDATANEARAAGALICDVPVNRGQGAALRLGYRLAREGGATYLVTIDADGQYDPAGIETVLGPIVNDAADFVTGSRRLGSQESNDLLRRAGVRFFAFALTALTGHQLSDTSFGLRAMRVDLTGGLRLDQPQYQAAELLITVLSHGYRVREVPARIRRRRVGESKKGANPLYNLHVPGVNNLVYGLRFARVMVGTWWRERRHRASRTARSGRTRT
jgi:glycosyltransferase involved in cell wall biosynthesis